MLTRKLHNDDFDLLVITQKEAEQRHSSRINVTFADGHVESFKISNLLLNNHDTYLRKWHRDNQPHLELFPSTP
jgi:prepilin-type processing-associated H-X9-DG protein